LIPNFNTCRGGAKINGLVVYLAVKIILEEQVEVNSLGEFIYIQFLSGKVEQRKYQRIYVENSQRKKIAVKKERDSTKSERL